MQDSRLVAKLKDVAREAQTFALDVERGQAATPLADHCQAVVDDFLYRAPVVAVLATTASARREALRYLLGPAPAGAVLRAAAGDGVTEIELEGEGYTVLSPEGLRVQVADLSGFLGALESLPGSLTPANQPTLSTPHDTAEPGNRPALVGSGRSNALTLLLPSSVSAVVEQVGLLGELQSRAQLFVLAHEQHAHGVPSDMWLQLQQVLAGVMVWWPMSVDSAPGAAPAPWWRELQALPAVMLAPSVAHPAAGVPPLQGPVADCLRPWGLQAAAERLRHTVSALKERVDHDVAQLQARRGREEEDGRLDVTADTQQRRPFDLARASLVDELAAAVKPAAEAARRSLLPDGSLSVMLGDQLRRLEHADLEHEAGSKSVKLTLASVAQGQLVTSLRRCLKDEVTRDVAAMAESLLALQRRLEPALEAAAGVPVRLSMSAPDSAALWSEISDMVSVDVRYRGEMPRRGFFQRLGEGRKAVFAGMMVLSLLGSFAGFSWRGVGLLGVAFLLVFVAVVMLTYRNWQREDAERLDKELERVREQLSTECRRLAGEVQREKVVRLTAHADQIKRQVQMQIDDLQRDRQQREQAQLAELRDRSRRRKEQLDRQLREAQGHAARLGKLLQEAQRLHDDAVHDARDVAAKRGLLA